MPFKYKPQATYYKRNQRLKQLGFADYSEYLMSPHWRSVKERAYLSKSLGGENHRCRNCETKVRLELHHKTYKSIGNENLNHLIWLCRDCHSIATKKFHTGASIWKCHK